MKRYRIFLFQCITALVAILTLATCADTDFADELGDEKPIILSASRAFDATRAVTTNVQDVLFEEGEKINVWIEGSDDGGTTWGYENICDLDGVQAGSYVDPIVFSTSAATNGTNILYPDEDTNQPQPYYPLNPVNGKSSSVKARIHAAYPADVTHQTETFTVQYDQTTKENYKKSDLMFAAPFTHAKNNEVVSLPFKHKMVKLIINAIPDGGVTIDPEITLGSIMRSVDINVEKGDFVYTDDTKTKPKVSDDNEDNYKERKIKMKNGGAVLFPPQFLESVVEFILITGKDEGGQPQTAQFDIIGKTFEAGRVYTLNLHISNNDFTPHAELKTPHVSTITGWTEDYDELTVTPSGGYKGVTIDDIDGNVTAETSTSGAFTAGGNFIYSVDENRKPVPCCPTPTVTYGDDDVPMIEGTDFRYQYVDNLHAGNNAQVMIIGIGKYAGLAALKPFKIERAQGEIYFPANSDKTGDNAVDFYPDLNIGFVKAENTGDGVVTYSVIADGDGEDAGCASVDPVDGFVILQNVGKCTILATVENGRNYDYPEGKNTCKYKLEIKAREVKVGNLTVDYEPKEFTFDGTTKELTKLNVYDGEHTLALNVDYTYTFTDKENRYEGLPIHHGTALLTIKGKGNYDENTAIEIEIPIKQAKATLEVKTTELALGEYKAAAPKDRRKTREAITEEWAKSKLRFSVSATEDVKENSVVRVTNTGLLTGLGNFTLNDQAEEPKSTIVYVVVDADDSQYQDWAASEQQHFDVKVYKSDFQFKIVRHEVAGYYEKQVKIMSDGIPEGAHTEWMCQAKGEWQIDCYGAQGGTTPKRTCERSDKRRSGHTDLGPAIKDNAYDNQGTGGRGAHIAGRIKLPKGMLLHVNLGQKGRVVYPGEQRVRYFSQPTTNTTTNRDSYRGTNGGKQNGDVSTLKAGDYEWAGFAWNGGGGLVWGAHNMYQHPMYYDQDNWFVGCNYTTENSPKATGLTGSTSNMGQSYNMFPMPSGGGATDVSLAWDEENGRYKPYTAKEDEDKVPTGYWRTGFTDSQKNGTRGWAYAHNMVNREYGVGIDGDDKHMVGVQWKNPAHLYSRIIVAGGGGGGLYYDSNSAYGDGGYGGAWEGQNGLFNDYGTGGYVNEAGRGGAPYYNWKYYGKSKITRTDNRTSEYNATGTGTTYPTDIVYYDGPIGGSWSCTDGMFGEGGNTFQPAQGCGGGGGGWYGGGGGGEAGQNGTGGGGSSFIWTDQVKVQPYLSTNGSRGTAKEMYKFYDSIDEDYKNFNGWYAGSPKNYSSYIQEYDEWHKKASNFYEFMPTNATARANRNNRASGIECPFFHQIVTADAGTNAGDGWAKITLVEIDDEQPTTTTPTRKFGW